MNATSIHDLIFKMQSRYTGIDLTCNCSSDHERTAISGVGVYNEGRGVEGEREAIIEAWSRMSFSVAMPRSAWPRRDIVVPAPDF